MDSPAKTRTRPPRPIQIGLVIGWLVIIAKCIAAPSIIAHWQIPIGPAWVIVPTLIFAMLVTALALTHDWKREEE
jgi:hypothetical protein